MASYINTKDKYIPDPNNANASIPNKNYVEPTSSANVPSGTTTQQNTQQSSSSVDLSSVAGLTGEAKTNALKSLATELAKRTGVNVDNLTDSNVVVDSSQLKNQSNQEQNDNITKSNQELTDLSAEASKLALQKQIADYKSALGINEQPATPNLTSEYSALSNQYGIDSLNNQLSDINNQITDLTSSYKEAIAGEAGQGRGITTGIVTGKQSKLNEEYQNKLQTLQSKQANISSQISNANTAISTIMGYKQQDYSNATANYNNQFSQQMQLSSALNSKADESKQEANANLNIVLNSIKGTAWDDLDASSKVSIQKLALQSGIDESLVKALVDSQDVAEILTTSEGYDANGNEIKTIIYKDKNGKAGVVETVSTGAVKSGNEEVSMTPEEISTEILSSLGYKEAKNALVKLQNKGIISGLKLGLTFSQEDVKKAIEDNADSLLTLANSLGSDTVSEALKEAIK